MAPVFCRDFGLRGLWLALFHSVSAFCNAGFDLMGNRAQFSSLTTYAFHPVINLAIMALIVIGGIGFLTWDDIRTNGWHLHHYKMQSKVILCTTVFLLFFPAVYFYVYEFRSLPLGDRLLASAFQSVTPRTAGFNTVDLTEMSESGLFLIISLMLIGGSPGSTAGGMKTTTIAVLIATAAATFSRKENAHFFGRRIENDVVKNAATIFLMYTLLFFIGGLVMSIAEGLPALSCRGPVVRADPWIGNPFPADSYFLDVFWPGGRFDAHFCGIVRHEENHVPAAAGEDYRRLREQPENRKMKKMEQLGGSRMEQAEMRGKLKIFFGYAPGVGKTYAMLEAARQAKKRGIDVVVGYIEPHVRPKTRALLRKPQLILVDELAHTNAEGSRHVKRYQDVEELLKAGIDVYTTVNVQHPESLNDTVAAVTGMKVQERIPDSIFDRAEQEYRVPKRKNPEGMIIPLRDVGKCVFMLVAATLLGYGFYMIGFTEANIITVYILGVLVISIITTNRLCSRLASLVSVLVFNFFFSFV